MNGGQHDGQPGKRIIYVQTASLAYLARHGMPLGRIGRPEVAWCGDMDLASHAWELLKYGPLDVHVAIGEPVPLNDFTDRKVLARHTEKQIRDTVVGLLRGREGGEAIQSVPPSAAWARAWPPASNAGNNATWI